MLLGVTWDFQGTLLRADFTIKTERHAIVVPYRQAGAGSVQMRLCCCANPGLTFGRDRFTVGPVQSYRQHSFATAGFYYFTHAQRALC